MKKNFGKKLLYRDFPLYSKRCDEKTESTAKCSKDEKKATGAWREVPLRDCKWDDKHIYVKCVQKKIVSSIYINSGKHDDKKLM